MFKIYDGREYFYQWDVDRKLIVNDAEITQVHFCNRTDECSLVCATYQENGLTLVNVPNVLLQSDWRINVYAYNKNYTKFSKAYPVVKRSKPDNYIYTETETLNYEALDNRMKQIENNIGEKIEEYLVENPIDVDLTGYVKNTDYATTGTAGVVKVKDKGGLIISADGLISVRQAYESDIEYKNALYPITPTKLDYAVKTSLTTNAITLTDEEKNTVKSWLGIKSAERAEINSAGELIIHYSDGSFDNLGVISSGGGGDEPEDEPEEETVLLEAGAYKFKNWNPTEAEFSQKFNYEIFEPNDYYAMNKMAFVDGVLILYYADDETGGNIEFDSLYDNEIYVREAQYVSKTFYDWLMENATLFVELPIGMYSFNDSLTEAEFEQNLSYEVYEGTYEMMTKIRAFYEDGVWKLQFIYAWDGMSFTELKYMDEKAIHINESGQYVSKTFYDWLMANTKKQ